MIRVRFADWPLRRKIAALLLAASVVPLVVAQGLAWARARKLAEEHAVTLLGARAEQLAAELEQFNRSYLAASRRIASLPATVRAVTAPGQRTAEEARPYLAVWPETDDRVLAVSVADRAGRVVVSSEQRFVGSDLSFRPYFRDALAGGPVVSDPFVALPVAGRSPLIAYASPLFADARGVGVAILFVRATAFWDAVRAGNDRAGPGSYSVLLDRWGVRLAHSSREDGVFRPAGELPEAVIERFVAERRFGERTRELLSSPLPNSEEMRRAVTAAAPGRGAFHIYSPANDAMNVGVARRLANAPWTLFYFVPVATIDLVARRVGESFVPGLALVGLALLLGLLVAGRVARPVAALSSAIEALAEGREDVRVPAAGRDELSRLAKRFNQMAEAVVRARSELEARVRERTADLSSANVELEAQKFELVEQGRELQQQQRELQAKTAQVEHADRLKSEFLANMSHELRTPLNSVIGFSELLAEEAGGKLSAKEAGYLDDVQRSGRHLLALINDILDLSKIEAGQVTLEIEDLDAASVIADATGLVLPVARRKRIDIRAASGPLPPVRGDAGKLRQILLNLLSNAIKFAPEGSAVEVGAEPEGELVRFHVRDGGPGIDDALRARIFEPFVQGESPLVKKHQGTGLGLAICRRLVDLHGGRIGVQSSPGAGATFSFTIPAGEGASAGDEPGKPLVLLAEDDAAAARALAEWLGREGYRVVEVTKGGDAWELASRLRPAAVVLDTAAAGVDGFQLLDQLKRHKETRDIPVVVSSVPHAADFLSKPLERDRLLGCVAAAAGPGGGTPPPLVLAIDDDAHARALLRAVIEPAGYRVETADGGRAGIAAARALPPDLVIVDLLMPDLSGFEVVEALSDDPRTRHAPVIVLTAADVSETERVRLRRHVRAIAEKGNATLEELLGAIRRALAPERTPPGGATALVVDDNDLNRELARALLERRAWRVLLADGGDAGLELARRERPDLVLLDLAMPGKDGFEVARVLKADPATASTPLVALTALAMRGDEQKAHAAGFDGYLTKPIDRNALDDVLRRFARGRAGPNPSAEVKP